MYINDNESFGFICLKSVNHALKFARKKYSQVQSGNLEITFEIIYIVGILYAI